MFFSFRLAERFRNEFVSFFVRKPKFVSGIWPIGVRVKKTVSARALSVAVNYDGFASHTRRRITRNVIITIPTSGRVKIIMEVANLKIVATARYGGERRRWRNALEGCTRKLIAIRNRRKI